MNGENFELKEIELERFQVKEVLRCKYFLHYLFCLMWFVIDIKKRPIT